MCSRNCALRWSGAAAACGSHRRARYCTCRRGLFPARQKLQRERFRLPAFPTTTIGSFPQTAEIRAARAAFKRGASPEDAYREAMRREIGHAVSKQEELGIDVLVHGEAERNDMVEYFGEQLEGFAFTANGWVQSCGSRCVKPPILFGDVSRPHAMTVDWTVYAQSLTRLPMKGMLTGPITILQWSFVRADQPRADTALQIALSIRDEVVDLEAAGIGIIQIDEPAIREGLPLRRGQWQSYLRWAARALRVSASGVADTTQIHTHMCYSEFNDILPEIAAMDADVITIETSRSDMELLRGFGEFKYPNEIGPGVYDIHEVNKSPRCDMTVAAPALQLTSRQDWAAGSSAASRALASFLPMVRSAAMAGRCLARGRASPPSHLAMDLPDAPTSSPQSCAESPSRCRCEARPFALKRRFCGASSSEATGAAFGLALLRRRSSCSSA